MLAKKMDRSFVPVIPEAVFERIGIHNGNTLEYSLQAAKADEDAIHTLDLISNSCSLTIRAALAELPRLELMVRPVFMF